MQIPEHIFKAYDIRGLVDTELSSELVRAIGQAYVTLTGARRVAVGRDMRPSSPVLQQALMEGLCSMGADVVDIGMCSTPMLYVAVGMDEAIDGGIMVTASHNPQGWNGLKLVHGDNLTIHAGHGMEDLRELVKANAFVSAAQPGSVEQRDTREAFLTKLLSAKSGADLSSLSVVVDAGNGMNGPLVEEFFSRLSVACEGMYLDPDGTFPNHEANPIKPQTLVDLQRRVKETSAQVGFAYDADGDRIGVVDERGEMVPADLIAGLLAQQLLKQHPGGRIYGNVQTGRDFRVAVERAGGVFELTPVGHSNIKQKLASEGGVMAAELSGHFFFSSFFRVESTLLTTLFLLELMAQAQRPLSELVAAIRGHVSSGEINFHVQDKQAMMDELKALFVSEAETFLDIDGYRFEFADWWFGVRPSNTEPLLRLNVEAATPAVMEARRDQLVGMITQSVHGGTRE